MDGLVSGSLVRIVFGIKPGIPEKDRGADKRENKEKVGFGDNHKNKVLL